MEGPGIESRWGEIFRPSRPALGPTQSPVKWVRLFSEGKERPGRAADHSLPSSAVVVEEYGYICTHPLGHKRACNGNTLPICGIGLKYYTKSVLVSRLQGCSPSRSLDPSVSKK